VYAQFEDGDWYPALVTCVRVASSGSEGYDVEFEGFEDFEKDALGLTLDQVRARATEGKRLGTSFSATGLCPDVRYCLILILILILPLKQVAAVSEFEENAPVARGANANMVPTMGDRPAPPVRPPVAPRELPPSPPPKPLPKPPKPASPRAGAGGNASAAAPKPAGQISQGISRKPNVSGGGDGKVGNAEDGCSTCCRGVIGDGGDAMVVMVVDDEGDDALKKKKIAADGHTRVFMLFYYSSSFR
jgi:hypothetical protein